jgi:UrcA family protein
MHPRSGTHSVSAVLETGWEMTMNIATPRTGLRALIATAIFGALAASFGAASAADLSSVSVTVKYADLNIASPSGARVLYQRIRAAAQSACSYFLFETGTDEAHCVRLTIERAVAKVNQPALSAIFNAKFKASA